MPPEGTLAPFSPYVAWGFSPMRTWICRNIIFFIVNLLTGLFPAWYLVYNLITNYEFFDLLFGNAPLPPVQFVGGRATSENVPRQSLGTSTRSCLRLALRLWGRDVCTSWENIVPSEQKPVSNL